VPNLGDEPVIPHNGFATFEEGEKAFIYLLRKAGVDPNWTWEQTMRATITDPLYRSLNSLAEKKSVFEKVFDQIYSHFDHTDGEHSTLQTLKPRSKRRRKQDSISCVLRSETC
jgi:hypothetical protein